MDCLRLLNTPMVPVHRVITSLSGRVPPPQPNDDRVMYDRGISGTVTNRLENANISAIRLLLPSRAADRTALGYTADKKHSLANGLAIKRERNENIILQHASPTVT
jgi:hypothetical protein